MNDLNSESDPSDADVNLADVNPMEINCRSDLPESSGLETRHSGLDEFEPPLEFRKVDDGPAEHWINRLRVVLSEQHQMPVAWIFLACLILMSVFFSSRWYFNDGLVDIDQVDSIRAEFKVDINSAELGEIVVLPGIGPKLAQAIVDHRQQSGDFESLDELCDVPGIGEKTLESLLPNLLPIQPVAPAK